MREKPSSSYLSSFPYGITPACAGKTRNSSASNFNLGDHPRVCGKNFEMWRDEDVPEGSPPRVREKLGNKTVLHHQSGITPACAGKTSRTRILDTAIWDHPRVCGKNKKLKTFSTTDVGSPPRVREKRRRTVLSYSLSGITPACAGKTLKH